MSLFDDAFALVIGNEGGYSNNPRDPGGETRFGISKRAYPNEDIRALTLDRAKEIYRRDYWDKVRGDELPTLVGQQVFDAAANHGAANAVRMLQSALGVTIDGALGPITLRAAWESNPVVFGVLFNAARLEFYTTLPTWPDFGRGWARRVASNLRALT